MGEDHIRLGMTGQIVGLKESILPEILENLGERG
jgi:hypothetical protein